MSNERHHPAPSIASWCSATSETDCIVWAVTTPKGPWSSDSQRNRSPGSVVRLRHQVFDPRTQSTPPAGSPLDAYAATGQA